MPSFPSLQAVSFLALVCLALTSCAPPSVTARSPVFEVEELDHATIILSFAGGADAGLLGNETNPELREQLRLGVGRELIRHAAYFGAEVSEPTHSEPGDSLLQDATDAYADLRSAAKKVAQSQEALDLAAPPALVTLAERVGAQRALVLYTTGWHMTTGNRVLSAVSLSSGPRSGIGIEATVLDAQSGQVEWFGQHYADLDPTEPEEVEAITAAFVFELITGRRVSAFSFFPWSKNTFVTVWPHEGKHLSGRLIRRDGFDVVLQVDDAEQRIPLAEVKRITQTSGTRIFPSPRHSSSVRRAF